MTRPREPRKAAALEYRPGAGMDAPRVVASGIGRLAERIVELARERGIPIHEDRDLAALLAKVEPGNDIPEELYAAVAEVLAFLYRTGRRARPAE